MLKKLFDFMVGRNFIAGDVASVKDMVKRYKQPPLTMHNRIAMQMTVNEYDALFPLLTEIQQYLYPVVYSKPVEETVDEPV
jgi:hypothetical protein